MGLLWWSFFLSCSLGLVRFCYFWIVFFYLFEDGCYFLWCWLYCVFGFYPYVVVVVLFYPHVWDVKVAMRVFLVDALILSTVPATGCTSSGVMVLMASMTQ